MNQDQNSNHIIKLEGVVQHYAWGGSEFLPSLLGIRNPDNQPFAELWMGTHPRGMARLSQQNQSISLKQWIDQNPELILGKTSFQKFGPKLPFLFKVLDVNKMLSIQIHPDKKAAERGFKRENEAGIALDAFHRNYKDDNHKPEIMVALSDFWLLHGFKSVPSINHSLAQVPELASLINLYDIQDVKSLYITLMQWPQEKVDGYLLPLKQRLLPLMERGALGKNSPDYWAAKAFLEYPTRLDRGIFSFYLFNLLKLQKGQGIFQSAGIPHAYLEGYNVELMANSDNVFRGGLTVKHIDVNELISHMDFKPVVPKILDGHWVSSTEKQYPCSSPDFILSQIVLEDQNTHHCSGEPNACIIICLEGAGNLTGDKQVQNFGKGEVYFVPAQSSFKLKSAGSSIFFKASIPV